MVKMHIWLRQTNTIDNFFLCQMYVVNPAAMDIAITKRHRSRFDTDKSICKPYEWFLGVPEIGNQS